MSTLDDMRTLIDRMSICDRSNRHGECGMDECPHEAIRDIMLNAPDYCVIRSLAAVAEAAERRWREEQREDVEWYDPRPADAWLEADSAIAAALSPLVKEADE